MDETAIAFEMPEVRAAATGREPLLDRISVRDYTRTVEIGAFRAERGVTQRIRFNVVLEVSLPPAAQNDDVDRIVSYDTITDAIEGELAAERVDLLETLAERVAARCLIDSRAVRVFVRIEKLDRVPGALGVEIVRTAPRRRAAAERPAAVPHARVVFVAPAMLAGPAGPAWLDALIGWGYPVVLCLAPATAQPPAATDAQRRIGLLAIEQSAWVLVDRDPRFGVAASRAELEWALKTRRPSVWAPTKMVMDARERPGADAAAPVGLAAWLAAEIGAELLVVVGAEPPRQAGAVRAIAVDRPQDLIGAG